MKQFRIRCSAIGTLMTGEMGLTDKQEIELQRLLTKKIPLTDLQSIKVSSLKDKKENPKLPQTAKSFLQNVKKEFLYNKRKEFTSKYTDKGHMVEDAAIAFVCEELDLGFAMKNERHFGNEWMKGTPDIILADEIIDTKASWDCFSFPLFEEEVDKNYWWQGQGYMHLTGLKKYKVAYCLMDMPEPILMRLARMNSFKVENEMKGEDEIYEELKIQYTYSNLPSELRLKIYEFEYDPAAIERVIERVKLSRKYLKELETPAIKKVLETV